MRDTGSKHKLESQAGTDLRPVADSHVSHSTKRPLPAGLWDPSVSRSGQRLKNEVHSSKDWFSHKWGDSMETGRWTANSTPKWGFEEFLFFSISSQRRKEEALESNSSKFCLACPSILCCPPTVCLCPKGSPNVTAVGFSLNLRICGGGGGWLVLVAKAVWGEANLEQLKC